MKIINIWKILNLTFLASLIIAEAHFEGRIVGGYEADIHDIPFQVSLQLPEHCGGSLINKRYVLTAAHCTENNTATNPNFNVRLASSYNAWGGLLVKVIQIFQHEKFCKKTFRYDFAILKLEDYNELWLPFQIQYAQLPWQNYIEDGTDMTVSGWGRTNNASAISPILRALKVPIVNQKVCKKVYKNISTIRPEMLCAGYLTGGKDACRYDSGGPLFKENVVWGIVSWGYYCATPNYPGVYSRVSSVLGWIHSIAK